MSETLQGLSWSPCTPLRSEPPPGLGRPAGSDPCNLCSWRKCRRRISQLPTYLRAASLGTCLVSGTAKSRHRIRSTYVHAKADQCGKQGILSPQCVATPPMACSARTTLNGAARSARASQACHCKCCTKDATYKSGRGRGCGITAAGVAQKAIVASDGMLGCHLRTSTFVVSSLGGYAIQGCSGETKTWQ